MAEKTVTRMRRAAPAKEERPEAPVEKPVETLHWFGEPERICGNCQHFKRSDKIKHAGSCHNLISGRLAVGMRTSDGESACKRGFYPACDRWPIEQRLGIMPANNGG